MTLKDLIDLTGRMGGTRSVRPVDTSLNTAQCLITSIVFDSRKVEPNSIYVAIRGGKTDGHDYLRAAMDRGAIGLVVESPVKDELRSLFDRSKGTFGGLVIEVESCRRALAEIAAHFFSEPSKKLLTVGVTGTNGKTTTTYMLEAILNATGRATGVIGTINHHLLDRVWKSNMTTPDAVAFQSRLNDFVVGGAKAVALEASSHALDQFRVDAVDFDVAVFSNLTRDHLDYHRTMEAYFAAKSRLFTELLVKSSKEKKTAVIFADDPWGEKLASMVPPDPNLRVVSFGSQSKARPNHVTYSIEAQSFAGSRVRIQSGQGSSSEPHDFELQMPGIHNVQNAIAALLAAEAVGVDWRQGASALSALIGVPGRLERVLNDSGINVFVDYAHTDDALRSILESLESVRRQSKEQLQDPPRILTVFGCGGDRDKGKRPLMREAALSRSDRVFVTSDNPRSEDPNAIIDDIFAGVSPVDRKRMHREADRRSAIGLALAEARPGDVVLIAGKGHEDTQTVGADVIPFSDSAVAREILRSRV